VNGSRIFLEQLVVVKVSTRSGPVLLMAGLRTGATALLDSSGIYRAVTAVDGKPTPMLWTDGAYQAACPVGTVSVSAATFGRLSSRLILREALGTLVIFLGIFPAC
jgi:uncharacterized protein YhfF